MSVPAPMHQAAVAHLGAGAARPRTVGLLLAVLLAGAAVRAGAPAGSPEQDPRWLTGDQVVLVRGRCAPAAPGRSAVDALTAGVACRDAALAARARALELDPIR